MNNEQHKDPNRKSTVALTMGDPAGVGPEIIARGWKQIHSDDNFQFVVFGLQKSMQRAVDQLDPDLRVQRVMDVSQISDLDPSVIPVVCPEISEADKIVPGQLSAAAGDAAFQFIEMAIEQTIGGSTDAIVTAPINKEAIRMAGHDFPGHTEILADHCGVQDFAMMLYIPEGQQVGGPIGLGVVHTTLHQSLRSALDDLSTEQILSKCQLANDFALASLRQLEIDRPPKIAVAALNPHAGEHGLFGNEEAEVIAPAVLRAQASGMTCSGPYSCDTLMGRAVSGEFDMVVAMYHDQGHIALKLLGMHKAVNVTLGLPITRTSVAHGTAFEIAGSGQADCTSLVRAVQVAKRLKNGKKQRCLDAS